NVGDKVKLTVSLPTMPTTGVQKTLVLKMQYIKANFDVEPTVFTVDGTKYFTVDNGSCTVISATYDCKRIDITRKDGTNFVSGEEVAVINLVAKAVTATTAQVIVFPATTAT